MYQLILWSITNNILPMNDQIYYKNNLIKDEKIKQKYFN